MSEDESGPVGEVTRQLRAYAKGEDGAEEKLWELVYDELRPIASRLLRSEQVKVTLQPTAIVNEAALRLFGGKMPDVQNRRHFLAIAATAMRQVLVDHARKRNAVKRGQGWHRVSLSDEQAGSGLDVDVLDLHEALERLAELGERHARIVELRYFGGLTMEETAEQLGVSRSTVRDDWAGARAWLYRELKSEPSP